MNVPFLQTATFTGLVSTNEYYTSQEWSQAYDIATFYSQNSAILIEQTTFSELTSLKANNQLKPGQYYQINDFELKWRGQGLYDPEPFKSSGVIEPLLVLALSSNKISGQAYSTLHPNDIVYYNIDAKTSTGWGIFPGPGGSVPGIKGWITRRIDTTRNIDIGWDWRYIKNNCCKYDFSAIPVWNSSNTYNFKNLVQSPTGKLYYSIQNNNTNRSLTDTDWWAQYSDATSEVNTFYPSGEIDSFAPLQAIKLTSIFPYTITPILSTRTQLPTFSDANSVNLKNIKIESGFNNLFLSNLVQDCTIGTDFYCNIITGSVGFGRGFEKNTIKSSFYNNNIGSSFINNTINNNFNNNTTNGYRTGIYPTGLEFCTIQNTCSNNHFGINFAFNTVGDSCISNLFIGRSRNNSIENNLQTNTVFPFFENNIILSECKNNIINNSFVFNKIGESFQNNTLGANFIYNNIGNNFYDNTIGNFFQFNNIQNNFGNNIIGTDFSYNNIGNTFDNNSVGNIFQFNNIASEFQNNTTSINFIKTNIGNSIASINFTGATHVYNNYDKNLFLNFDSIARLSYFNSNDQLVVTDPTS